MAEAPYTAMKNTPAPPGLLVSTGPDGLPQVPDPLQGALLGPGQQAEFDQYRAMLVRSHNELQAAHSLLNRAVQLRDSQAKHYADQINSACDDALRDSWWDGFIDLMNQWAWLIKDIATALEVIATIVAVLALIFSGVGWLLILGLVVTSIAALCRLMLAVTGNGSWADFGLDVVAILSFGMGQVLTKALADVAKAMPAVAKGIATAKVAEQLASFGDLAGDAAKSRVLAKFLTKAVPVVEESAATTFWERLLWAGDRGVVNSAKTIGGLVARFGDDAKIVSMASQAKFYENLLRANFVVSNVSSFVPLVAGGIEIDGPGGLTIIDPHIPGIKDLYQKWVEDPTTADNGLPTPSTAVDWSKFKLPSLEIPSLQGFEWVLSNW
jgi:hypothetical protein